MKISFDFDGTLDQKPMQRLAKQFMLTGHEVFITTSRGRVFEGLKTDNTEVYKVAEELGIAKDHITFTIGEQKFDFVKDYDMHFDDDDDEIFLINEYPANCIGFLYEHNYSNGQATF